MNIDKDIEKIQSFLKYNETMREKETYIIEFREAIENVLSELKIKDGEIEFRKQSEEYFENREEILMKELKIYIKIAEKLALLFKYYDKDNNCQCQITNFQKEKCNELNLKTCVKCIIDWARKEVENGNKIN